MINLKDATLIGQGRDRDCYRHPEIATQCIKVSRRPQKQTKRERVYFSLLMLWERDTSHLAHYLGSVKTSLGEGATYELMLDDDGQISETLTEVIRNQRISKEKLRLMLDDLKAYLLDNLICVRDISPNNIMCQKLDGVYRLVIVDGVSNPGVNPLNIRLTFLARHFIRRSWRSLESKLSNLYAEMAKTSVKASSYPTGQSDMLSA
ncbi:MAG TPA: hypothetical protein DEA26_02425 [Oceanospirillales bacterium]|nr:hypothetical protein [Oceanospirillaceae bacterium]HBS41509.1 hypothetical protein [Oceanospirillales bacterium]|tara:strand:- start:6853 stop:7470 length:618 start_codon:yes stop_codon:yes gene_type:complete